jgi:2Fe-2S ferredoxin
MNVRLEPLGIDFPVRAGESVMAAGQRAGLKWPTVCSGMAQCGWCHVAVIESAEPLTRPGPQEAIILKHALNKPDDGSVRLACQLKPKGDLVIERAGIRPATGAS